MVVSAPQSYTTTLTVVNNNVKRWSVTTAATATMLDWLENNYILKFKRLS